MSIGIGDWLISKWTHIISLSADRQLDSLTVDIAVVGIADTAAVSTD